MKAEGNFLGWGKRSDTIGWQEGHLAYKNLYHLPPDVLFQNNQRKTNSRTQLANPGWPEN